MSTSAFLDKYFECESSLYLRLSRDLLPLLLLPPLTLFACLFAGMDSMPLDLQRYVTQLREIELEKRGMYVLCLFRLLFVSSTFSLRKGLFEEIKRLREELVLAVEHGSTQQMLLFRQLQECLLEVREVGNTKLSVSAQMLDTVSSFYGVVTFCCHGNRLGAW